MSQDGILNPLVNTIYTDIFLSWSPDSEWVYFSSQKLQPEDATLFRVKHDGTALEELAQSSSMYEYEGHAWELKWTPDNRFLLILINRDGNIDLYKMRSDGTEQTRLTYEHGLERVVSYSPQGTLLIEHIENSTHSLYEINLDGTQKRNLHDETLDDAIFTTWMPNNNAIIVWSNHQLFWSKFDKINWTPLINESYSYMPYSDRFETWSGDGRWMYFSTNRGLYRMNTVDGSLHQLSKSSNLSFVTSSARIELRSNLSTITAIAVCLMLFDLIVNSLRRSLTIFHH